MAIILAILTFAVILLAARLLERRREAVSSQTATTWADGIPEPLPTVAAEPSWVAGYRLPEQLYYHAGHTWARVVSRGLVAVGLDDFGCRLVGSRKRFRLPSRGAWLRQGAAGFGVAHNGRATELLSPVDGEVVEVNPDVAEDPAVTDRDPYGKGWLFKVRCPDLGSNLRNLLNGSLARRWIENTRDELELELMAIKGSVLQDGADLAGDFADDLEPEEWQRLARVFFRV